jgi:serine/threonine protein kinase
VDWWALGILLYEMVVGYTPFRDAANNNQRVIFRNIEQAPLVIPPSVRDGDLRDVMTKLLAKRVGDRLGCRRGGAEDVRAHPFFAGVDWAALRARAVPAPWRPALASDTDTGNFDEYEEEEDAPPPYVPDGSNWDAEF